MKITPYLPGMHIYMARKKLVKTKGADELAGVRDLLRGKADFSIIEGKAKSGANSRDRGYSRANVFILFLLQVLGGISCDHAVKFMQTRRSIKGGKPGSSNSSAYCQGRIRLELPLVMKLFKSLSSMLIRSVATRPMWKDFRVVVVDGTGVDMPDTKSNRKAYPPRGEKVKGCSFPQMNIVALFDLFSGAVIDWRSGDKHWGEQSLWKSILKGFAMTGTIFLGDTYYCSYGNIATTIKKGGHCILPVERKTRMRPLRRLGRGDKLVRIHKPAARAQSWTKPQWGKFPGFIDLRLIERTIDVPGFKSRKLRLLTTLLDHKTFPADEIAALQSRRWNAELYLRDIKTAMGMDHLSCKSPTMIKKEIAMHMIAYSLVRAFMEDAACASGIEPGRLSFTKGMEQSGEWIRAVTTARIPKKIRRMLVELFIEVLSDCVVPFRPGRSEPRAVKRHLKKHPRLIKPRRMYPAYRKAA